MKPVIIVADSLPTGLKANFAAVLGMSLGRLPPDLVGADTPAGDGTPVAGITTVPVPVLGAAETDLPGLFAAAGELPVRLAYMRAAFEARDYADYTRRMAEAPLPDQAPLAVLLAGPRKAVDRICGRLPLLR